MARVSVATRQNLQVEIQAGPHTLLADEPVEKGGEGTGPDPYELLLSAIGACMCMTVVLYAKRKGWALSRVRADLRHEKVPAASLPEAQGREGMVDRIETHLEVDGDLSDEQYTRLLEISQRCPVKKTVAAGAVIVSK